MVSEGVRRLHDGKVRLFDRKRHATTCYLPILVCPLYLSPQVIFGPNVGSDVNVHPLMASDIGYRGVLINSDAMHSVPIKFTVYLPTGCEKNKER